VNPEAICRLSVDKGVASVGVMPTGRIESARIELSAGGKLLKGWQKSISPAEVFKDSCPVEGVEPGSIWLRVFDASGREIIAHQNGHYAQGPSLVEPSSRPYGDRPEPAPDKLSAAVGQVRQGLYAQAAESLTALADGGDKSADAEAVKYYLGLAEAGRGRTQEAAKHWEGIKTAGPIHDAAIIELAKLLLAQRRWTQAVERLGPLTDRRNAQPEWQSTGGPQVEAQVYLALALRQMQRPKEARAHLQQALQRDPLCLLGQAELALLDGRALESCSALRDEERRIEAATAYMALKQYETAERLLRPPAGKVGSATACYLRAHLAELMGNAAEAARLRQEAARATVRNCMPNRIEELAALEAAIRANAKDASARYLAGLASHGCGRKDEAVAHWRQAGELGHQDAVVYRCLGSVTVDAKPEEALKYFERALALEPQAAEVYADLDYVYMQLAQPDKRIAVLERGLAKLPGKDELAHRLAVAYFDAGRYNDAVKCYQSHRFHVAEGQRDLHDNYAIALVGRAMGHLSANRNKEALADLDAALEYPENLGIGRSERSRSDAVVQYWRGVVLGKLGQADEAAKAWQEASGRMRFSRRRGFYGPESGLGAVHSVMILRRLGQAGQADDLARSIQDASSRLESSDPPHGKAFAAMIRGLLAAAQGKPDEAARLLDQAQAAPSRASGYCRLVRTWADLLKQVSSSQPAAP
jgi:tetratricopeptide (TPR) repeat protein